MLRVPPDFAIWAASSVLDSIGRLIIADSTRTLFQRVADRCCRSLVINFKPGSRRLELQTCIITSYRKARDLLWKMTSTHK